MVQEGWVRRSRNHWRCGSYGDGTALTLVAFVDEVLPEIVIPTDTRRVDLFDGATQRASSSRRAWFASTMRVASPSSTPHSRLKAATTS